MSNVQKGIVLEFPNLHLLWRFAQQLHYKNIEINTMDRLLVCDCNEREIKLALTDFKARIKEGSLSRANA